MEIGNETGLALVIARDDSAVVAVLVVRVVLCVLCLCMGLGLSCEQHHNTGRRPPSGRPVPPRGVLGTSVVFVTRHKAEIRPVSSFRVPFRVG